MNYFFNIAFDGNNYHGWQRQLNANTVQAEFEKALAVLTSQKIIESIGCGRTDTGVHASCFFIHVNLLELKFSLIDLKHKLNRILPSDISVNGISQMPKSAHARFDAKKRTYQYHVHHEKNIFNSKYSVNLHRIPDYDKMNSAACFLLIHNEFGAFCKSNSNNKTNSCTVFEAVWKKTANGYCFTISADRFLRNMVRAIVGTLLKVGYSEISIEEFKKIVVSGNRCDAGESVPAHGLFLTNVEYPYPVA